jgi:hypothetical protein
VVQDLNGDGGGGGVIWKGGKPCQRPEISGEESIQVSIRIDSRRNNTSGIDTRIDASGIVAKPAPSTSVPTLGFRTACMVEGEYEISQFFSFDSAEVLQFNL